jgi:hypothetical protein
MVLRLTPKTLEERHRLFGRLPRAAAEKLAALGLDSWGALLLYSIIEARGGQPTARWVEDNFGIAQATVKAARRQLRAAGLLPASPRRNGTKVAHIERAGSGADGRAGSGAPGGTKVAHGVGTKVAHAVRKLFEEKKGESSSPQIFVQQNEAKAIYGELWDWIAPRDSQRGSGGDSELKWVCRMVAAGKLPPAAVISAAEKVAQLPHKPPNPIQRFLRFLDRRGSEFERLREQELAAAAQRRAEDDARRAEEAARRDAAVLDAAAERWLAYKEERGEGYKPAARQALTTDMRKRAARHGAAAVAAAIDAAMAANASGWNYPSRFEGSERRTNP